MLSLVVVLLAGSTLAERAMAGEDSKVKAFGNADVMNLLKAGIEDSVIIAKIKQAPEVSFQLEADDLVALKQAGASPEVISAMLRRTTPEADNGPKAPPSFPPMMIRGRTGTATLVTRDGRQALSPSMGEMSTTGFAYYQAIFLNYPGLHATITTGDLRPSVVIHSEFDPKEHYFLGKLDPDTKINARSLKVKSKSRGFSYSGGLRPDEDWVAAYTATEEEKGVWKLTPNRDLEPGEYGLFDGLRLFGFAVVR